MSAEPLKETDRFKELKASVDRLQGLLRDPQPGLFTWSAALARELGLVAEFALGVSKAFVGDLEDLVIKRGGSR